LQAAVEPILMGEAIGEQICSQTYGKTCASAHEC
jgi:hypothetical protein